MDWQSSRDTVRGRDLGQSGNVDKRLAEVFETGSFARHDFGVSRTATDQVTLRAGLENAFLAEQVRRLATGLTANLGSGRTRYYSGLNYRPF